TKDAVDAPDAGENGFKLALIGDLQTGFDAGILAVGAAIEGTNIGARIADDSGDFSKQAGAILGADQEFDGEGGHAAGAPLDGNAALRLVQQVLHVGARARVDRDAAAPRDVSDDFI